MNNLEKNPVLKPELMKLDEAFKLLKLTTEQVALEATNTASFIKDQLHDTTYRFFSVIDSIDDIVIIKDSFGRWKTLNKFGQTLFNFNKEDYYNKTDLELAENFINIREMLEYCAVTDDKAWKKRIPHREIETLKINNKLHYFDMVKTPVFNEKGEKKELVIIGRDITEIKESDFKYKAFSNALNVASDNIFIIDKDGVVLLCNDAVIKTFGFSTHACIENHSISIISSGLMPKEIFEDLWKTVNNNNIWSGVIVNKHVNGSLINCKVTAIPVMNGSPKPIYYICTMKTANK